MKDKDTKEQLETIEKKLDMIIDHFSIGDAHRSPAELKEWALKSIEANRARRVRREKKKRQEQVKEPCQEKKK